MKTEKLYLDALESLPDDAQYIADYTDCDSAYICERIHDIADNAVPIYNCDLLEWLNEDHEAPEAIEEAVQEFGMPDAKDFNFYKLIQMGYYHKAEFEIYEKLDDVLLCWTYCYIWKQLKIEELTDAQIDQIEDINFKDADQFGEITAQVKQILEIED